jgi:hypothetical protein
MRTNACSEIEGKFTLEQRQLLGKVYATILRWSREDDDLLEKKQSTGSATLSTIPLKSAAMPAEISRQE